MIFGKTEEDKLIEKCVSPIEIKMAKALCIAKHLLAKEGKVLKITAQFDVKKKHDNRSMEWCSEKQCGYCDGSCSGKHSSDEDDHWDEEYCFSDDDEKELEGYCKFVGYHTVACVDFALFCGKLNVAIECDGREFHNEKKDEDRDLETEGLGWKTIRFKGETIHQLSEKTLAQLVIKQIFGNEIYGGSI